MKTLAQEVVAAALVYGRRVSKFDNAAREGNSTAQMMEERMAALEKLRSLCEALAVRIDTPEADCPCKEGAPGPHSSFYSDSNFCAYCAAVFGVDSVPKK